MKKSTLITTIAMIVVVVVALSTATYAWFTSSTTTVASSSIDVSGTAGWVIAGTSSKSLNDSTHIETATYDASVQISTLDMPNGLYTPICASNSSNLSANLLAGSNSTTATLQQTQWFTTTQEGTSVLTSVEALDTAPSYEPYNYDSTNYRTMSNYMRISNATGAPTGLRLVLTVYIADDATEATKLAVQNFCAFLTWRVVDVDGNVGDTAYYTNTAYDYAYGATAVQNSNPAKSTYSKQSVPKVTTSAGSAKAWTSSPTFIASGAFGYTDASSTGNSLSTDYAGTGNAKSTGYYYQYVLDFGELGNGESVMLELYAWFNGWAITSATPVAQADVFLAFMNTPA